MEMSLDRMGLGLCAEIVSIDESSITPKLVELGFMSGEHVEVLFKAPFGDPIAVEINGSVLSLRKEEAALIHIKERIAS